MERRERQRGPELNDGHSKTNRKPMTPGDLVALSAELDVWAALGQREMRKGCGITLPSGRRSTRNLRNGDNHR